jgi:hypothetical protein
MQTQDQSTLIGCTFEQLLPNPDLALELWLTAGSPVNGAHHCRMVHLVQTVPLGVGAAAVARIGHDATEGAARAGLTPTQWVAWLQAEGQLEHPGAVGRAVAGCDLLRGPHPFGPADAAALAASAAQVAEAAATQTLVLI